MQLSNTAARVYNIIKSYNGINIRRIVSKRSFDEYLSYNGREVAHYSEILSRNKPISSTLSFDSKFVEAIENKTVQSWYLKKESLYLLCD